MEVALCYAPSLVGDGARRCHGHHSLFYRWHGPVAWVSFAVLFTDFIRPEHRRIQTRLFNRDAQPSFCHDGVKGHRTLECENPFLSKNASRKVTFSQSLTVSLILTGGNVSTAHEKSLSLYPSKYKILHSKDHQQERQRNVGFHSLLLILL